MKRSNVILLLSCCVFLLSLGCGDDTADNDPCKDYKCPEIADYEFERICVSIDGKAECKDKCNATEEGETAPYCRGNGADEPEHQIISSYVSTCAKDPQGRLYVVSNTSTACPHGCDFDTGLCKNDDTADNDPCKDYKCPEIADYEFERICVSIDDKAECKDKCNATEEGETAPYCRGNGADDPEHQIVSSYVSTCAKDPQGRLYEVSKQSTECTNGCDFDTGLCK